jgi:hypothetical protein
VYDDAFRAQPEDTTLIPFGLVFPEVTDAMGRDEFPADSRFINHSNEQPLPPSFRNFSQGFGHHYEAFIEYRIGVDLVMPQLQVDVDKPTKYLEPLVHYERPGASQLADGRPCQWRGFVSVRNELLLAESDRPSGFKQKAKAFIGAGHFPTYALDWICIGNKDIYLGQPASFEVHIQPRKNECTATLIPEVRLKYFHVDIVAHTQVRAHMRTFSCPEAHSNNPIGEITGIIEDSGPFSKANGNIKRINTLPLRDPGQGLFTSSFATYNISRTYTFKIAFAFEITDKVERFGREYGVTVHPSLEIPLETALPPLGIAGPSSQGPDTNEMTSELPQYEPLPPYKKSTATNGNEHMATDMDKN